MGTSERAPLPPQASPWRGCAALILILALGGAVLLVVIGLADLARGAGVGPAGGGGGEKRGVGPTRLGDATGALQLTRTSYTVHWSAGPAPAAWGMPSWHFGASIHAPGSVDRYQLLVSADLPSGTPGQGSATVDGVVPGNYTLDIAACDGCPWDVTLRP